MPDIKLTHLERWNCVLGETHIDPNNPVVGRRDSVPSRNSGGKQQKLTLI